MSGDNTDHILDLLPGYALGSLDNKEVRRVESHLPECETCRSELRSFEETVAHLSLALPEAEPLPSLRSRLLDRISSGRSIVPVPDAPTWWDRIQAVMGRMLARPLWQPLALLFILALAASNVWQWQRLSELRASPRPGQMLAIPGQGTAAVPDAAGFLLVSADGQSGAIVVDDLPQLDESRQYQLWLIEDGQRDSGAVFSVDELGYGGAPVQAPQSLFVYDSFGITVEPAGGSAGPTGQKVLEGRLFDT